MRSRNHQILNQMIKHKSTATLLILVCSYDCSLEFEVNQHFHSLVSEVSSSFFFNLNISLILNEEISQKKKKKKKQKKQQQQKKKTKQQNKKQKKQKKQTKQNKTKKQTKEKQDGKQCKS